jgi:hypothetical protein
MFEVVNKKEIEKRHRKNTLKKYTKILMFIFLTGKILNDFRFPVYTFLYVLVVHNKHTSFIAIII